MAGAEALNGSRVRPLVVLCGVTLIVRMAMLLCPGADLSEEGRVMAEEIVRGNTALEILRGPLLPLHDYQQPFWGGHIVISMIAAPIFALLGPTLFALRLATLPFALIGTCSIFLILDRLVGRRAAWIGGLLLAIPPPGYLLLSCTAQGTHLEATAINLFLVLLWIREREQRTFGRALTLGFAAGFALWFGFLALIPIALIFGADLLEKRTFFTEKLWWVRCGALVVGAGPWIRLNLLERGRGLTVYDKDAASWFDPQGLLARVGAKASGLVEQDLALSLWLPGSRERAIGVFAVALTLFFGIGWILAAWHARGGIVGVFRGLRTPHVLSSGERWSLVLLLAPGYVALYLVSHFELGPRDWLQNLRYLMPLWPLLFLGVAALMSRWSARVATIGSIVVLSVLALSDARRADASAFARDLHVQATSTRGLARMVAWSQKHDRDVLGTAVERLERWPADDRDEFLFWFGKWFRFWSAPTTKLGRTDMDRRAELDATREYLRLHVAPQYAPYFEAPAPDEVVNLGEELAAFWARRGGRPPQ